VLALIFAKFVTSLCLQQGMPLYVITLYVAHVDILNADVAFDL